MWKVKETTISLITHTSLRVSLREDWYFDIECFKHMTGEKNYLEELKPYSNNYVTFDDRARGKIKGMGKLVCPCFPCLDNVLMVEGLTTNLISISQIYDHGLNVNNKLEYIVTSTSQLCSTSPPKSLSRASTVLIVLRFVVTCIYIVVS